MTIPAGSLPGDHLRDEELHEGREALCRFMKENPAPISSDSVFSARLEQCLCAEAVGSVCLKEQELMVCRKALCEFMGVREATRGSQSFLERLLQRLSLLSRSTFPRMIAACCVLLILGNSVALAANATLPGDSLYPVKVKILEPATAIITVSPEKKVVWASTCIRRRLIEAERLIAQDRLTAETWKSLNDSIASNARVAERHIMRLSKQNVPEAVDLSADLHLMINAHGQVFSDIVQTEQKEVVAAAAADLSSTAADTARLYEEAEEAIAQSSATVEQAAARIMQSASSAAYGLGEAADATVQSVPERAKERGDIARGFLKDAEERFQAGEFRESLRNSRMAAQKAEEGNAFMRMGLKFDAGTYSKSVVPVTICGATIINVNVPAIAVPTEHSSSVASKETKKSSSSKKPKDSQSSSSSSSSVVTSSFISSRSSAKSVASSAASIESSIPITDVPSVIPSVPEIPLLH